MSPLISAVGVRKGFGKGSQRIEVLRGVDLEVGPGEFVPEPPVRRTASTGGDSAVPGPGSPGTLR